MVFGGTRITGASSLTRQQLTQFPNEVGKRIATTVSAKSALEVLGTASDKLTQGKKLAIYGRTADGESPRFVRQYWVSAKRRNHTVQVVRSLFEKAASEIRDDEARDGILRSLDAYLSSDNMVIRGNRLQMLVNQLRETMSPIAGQVDAPTQALGGLTGNQALDGEDESVGSLEGELSEEGAENARAGTVDANEAVVVNEAVKVQAAEPGNVSPAKIESMGARISEKLGAVKDPVAQERFRERLDACMRSGDLSERSGALRKLAEDVATQTRKEGVYTKVNAFHQGKYKGKRSEIAEAALSQFQSLGHHMFESALGLPGMGPNEVGQRFACFAHLMFPQSSRLNAVTAVEGVEAAATFVMGDADGSMGRMVVHAIASGVASVPEDAMPALARVLYKEADVILRGGDLRGFQGDQTICKDLDRIADALEVVPSPAADKGRARCIFLGDILSDRFTNNQSAMARLIYKLSGRAPNDPATGQRIETGVRFIAGNHDTLPLCDEAGRPFVETAPDDVIGRSIFLQWGYSAASKLNSRDYRQLLRDCFQAADYSGGVLTTHNGVVRGAGGDYLVGVGRSDGRVSDVVATSVADQSVSDFTRLTANSPEELAEKMNQIFHEAIGAGALEHVVSTDFRPQDVALTGETLGFAHLPEFRQVHGHDGNTNEAFPGVTNLNARNPNTFQPTATVVR